MSYLVLARKWRPQSFEEVVGQVHVTRVLQNAIRLGRIAHAYLFSGPRGVGKTSVARILAKALNCEKGPTPNPCGTCLRCVEIALGKSSDVLEIDGASHRGIDSIRSLQESIGYKPIKGQFKVYIIDEVHMLTTEAFNALLKTLEEPPSHVRFIFATTEVHRVPSTVVSRCQRFDFRRISTQEIASHLERIVSAEKVSISSPLLDAIAIEAEGSLRDAQTLLEQVIAFQGEKIAEDELLRLLGMVDRTSLFNVLEAVVKGDRRSCIKLAQEIYEGGCDEVKFLHRLLDLIHKLLIVKMMDGSSLLALREKLRVSDYERSFLEKLANKISTETLEIYYQILLRAIELAKRSSQPHFVLEMSLLKMANAPNVFYMPDLLRETKELIGKSKLVSREVTTPYDPVKYQVSEGQNTSSDMVIPNTVEDIVTNWDGFLKWVSSHDPVLYTQISKSTVRVGPKTNELILSVIPIYGENLRKGPSHDRLVLTLKSFFGIKDLIVTIEDDEELAKRIKKNQNSHDLNRIKQEALSHPLVREILELFNGSIVDVRPSAYLQNSDELDSDM
ncbi:MAG: DNA polymerase III subunit gamma/tau [Syntrophobacterales bacterium]|nr:DNA polymerase III subunit gamma/tau [Syntrophobacterales bacterium]